MWWLINLKPRIVPVRVLISLFLCIRSQRKQSFVGWCDRRCLISRFVMLWLTLLSSLSFIVDKSSVPLFTFESVFDHIPLPKTKYRIDRRSWGYLRRRLLDSRKTHIKLFWILTHVFQRVWKMSWKCILQIVVSVFSIKFHISHWSCVGIHFWTIYWRHLDLISKLVCSLLIILSNLILVHESIIYWRLELFVVIIHY